MQMTISFDRSESLDLYKLDLTRTCGTPVDGFTAELLWSADAAEAARGCRRVRIYADGALRFTGVVDEVTVGRSRQGRTLEVAGRGLAALMMRTELNGMEFAAAGWQDVKRRFVEPCGIPCDVDAGALSTLRRFSVTGGVSAWKALSDWAGAAGMLSPRFSTSGVLILRRGGSGVLTLDEGSAIFSAARRTCPADAISEVVIRERATGRQKTITAPEMKAAGVYGRDAIAAPRNGLEAKVPAANWLLEQSRRQYDRFTVELAGGFACEPGDRLRCSAEGLPSAGVVDSVRTKFDLHGVRCVVEGYVEREG